MPKGHGGALADGLQHTLRGCTGVHQPPRFLPETFTMKAMKSMKIHHAGHGGSVPPSPAVRVGQAARLSFRAARERPEVGYRVFGVSPPRRRRAFRGL